MRQKYLFWLIFKRNLKTMTAGKAFVNIVPKLFGFNKKPHKIVRDGKILVSRLSYIVHYIIYMYL